MHMDLFVWQIAKTNSEIREYKLVCMCVCVCVCEREREREARIIIKSVFYS